jgi:hypothetical protein
MYQPASALLETGPLVVESELGGLTGFPVRAWGHRRKGGYVRHRWFYGGLIVSILVAAMTVLGCGTAEIGSVSQSIDSSLAAVTSSTSAVADVPLTPA